MTITPPAARCAWCGWPLPGDGRSPDFCNETHQHFWQNARNGNLPTYADMRTALATAARHALVDVVAVVGPALRDIGVAAARFAAALQRAGLPQPPTPADPKQRALALRRTRNTGPAITARRPPIRIDPTRTRR